MFRFASPWFLLLLILPWFWLLVHTAKNTKRFPFKWLPRSLGHSLRVSSLTGTSRVPVSFAVWAVRLMPLVKVLALSLMIVALARPQAGERKINVETEGVNIVLALDLSGSMKAHDFKRDNKIVTRLDAVKGVVSDFIMKREGDRIGLVVFGSHAFTQVPLTRDYNTIAFMLDHLAAGAAGPSTAIGDALGISLKRLEDIPAKSNIIILLTDGKSNAGELSWQEAVKIAAQRKIKIHTIGVGSRGKVPFLVDGLFGKQYVYRQVDMDWDALDSIATRTGGTFFKAKDTDSLTAIYTMIDSMEKTKVKVDKWVDYKELYTLFLIPGLLLYLGCLVLGSTRLLELP